VINLLPGSVLYYLLLLSSQVVAELGELVLGILVWKAIALNVKVALRIDPASLILNYAAFAKQS
jgi:hypothetical protein